MASLLDYYAMQLGVIPQGPPNLNLAFFPCPEKFITIHGGDGKIPAKHFELFPEVISLLKPILRQQGYEIIQIGGPQDVEIEGVDKRFLHLSYAQSAYIQSRAALHLGIDSLASHVASAFDKPIVILYGHIYPEQAALGWSSLENVRILEPKWGERRPCFSHFESPKMIRTIKVEDVVNSVFQLLCPEAKLDMKTLRVGSEYSEPVIEIIPDFFAENPLMKNGLLHFRLDVAHNEQCLSHWLSNGYRGNVISKKPLPLELLKNFRPQINRVTLMVGNEESFSLNYVKSVKNLGLDILLIGENEENLPIVREKFFDYNVESLGLPERSVVESVPKDAKFFTKKQIHSNGKTYPSIAHYKNNLPFCRANKIIDCEEFWLDMEWFFFYS